MKDDVIKAGSVFVDVIVGSVLYDDVIEVKLDGDRRIEGDGVSFRLREVKVVTFAIDLHAKVNKRTSSPLVKLNGLTWRSKRIRFRCGADNMSWRLFRELLRARLIVTRTADQM